MSGGGVRQREKLTGQIPKLARKCPVTDCCTEGVYSDCSGIQFYPLAITGMHTNVITYMYDTLA